MGRTGGGNGSPPAGLSPRHGRGNGQDQLSMSAAQQQQHALSGRARQAMIALPIMLATFALGLQFSTHAAAPHPLTLPGFDGSASSERHHFMQLPSDRGAGASSFKRGVVQPWLPEATKLASDWQIGGRWQPANVRRDLPKLAFMTTTSDGVAAIRLWTQYHRAIGVDLFYMFVNGQAAKPDAIAKLSALPGVVVIPVTPELRARQEHSRIWNETWLAAFFHKPCNHELFVHQSLNMEEGIKLAQADGVDWVFHVDTDELMYPASAAEYSLQAVMEAVPRDVDTVVFPNYESMPERADVEDPFTEVTLFKRNYAHVFSEQYFKMYRTVSRGNPNYFITYGNGKSAARVQNGLRPNGAHRWFNYYRAPKEVTSESSAVLHYTFTRFSDLKARRDRCDCAPTEEDAKRCFILPFDRMAFMAASLKSDEELVDWFRQRLVWDDPAIVQDLLKRGLFSRIYTPQVIIRGFMILNDAEEQRRVANSAPLTSSDATQNDAVSATAAAALAPTDSRSSAVGSGVAEAAPMAARKQARLTGGVLEAVHNAAEKAQRSQRNAGSMAERLTESLALAAPAGGRLESATKATQEQ